MTLEWQAAGQAVLEHPLFSVGITLATYQLATFIQERTRWLFMQPFLIAMLLVIAILLLCDLPYARYRENTWLLTILLGPTTIALAVPLYLNLERIRALLQPIMLTLAIAGLFTTGLGMLLAWTLGASDNMLMTLAPKSVTSPIAMLVAEQIGGIAALAAVFVLITGVIGALLGPRLLTLCGIHHPAARGMAMGLTAHAVGTARAMQDSDESGAFAALAMSLMGVTTAILLPLVLSFTQ